MSLTASLCWVVMVSVEGWQTHTRFRALDLSPTYHALSGRGTYFYSSKAIAPISSLSQKTFGYLVKGKQKYRANLSVLQQPQQLLVDERCELRDVACHPVIVLASLPPCRHDQRGLLLLLILITIHVHIGELRLKLMDGLVPLRSCSCASFCAVPQVWLPPPARRQVAWLNICGCVRQQPGWPVPGQKEVGQPPRPAPGSLCPILCSPLGYKGGKRVIWLRSVALQALPGLEDGIVSASYCNKNIWDLTSLCYTNYKEHKIKPCLLEIAKARQAAASVFSSEDEPR